MSKIIAMIPARLGSQRVSRKNLRLLAGKPLISYAIEAAKASGVFDEIYVNSEAEVFREIAEDCAVRFYKRPEILSSHEAVNDDFAFDFICHVPGDVLVQLLPTSPLITPEEIRSFVNEMIGTKTETLVSVVDHQIACLYEQRPINFDLKEKHRSSQAMRPVQSYACVLMAWTYESFKRNMQDFGCAYHGGKGSIGYFPLKGLTTIDIDREEDFALAEVAMRFRQGRVAQESRYYVPRLERREHAEVDVPTILKNDGIAQNDFENENLPLVHLDEIIAQMGHARSWCRRLVNTENNSATLICQMPGEGNRQHYHPDWNEWWYIIQGQWRWDIEGEAHIVKAGDVVFIEKGKWHKITAVGNGPAIRLAVSRGDVPHVYREERVDDR